MGGRRMNCNVFREDGVVLKEGCFLEGMCLVESCEDFEI